MKTDILVVGAGAAGLTFAYEARKSGKDVLVAEKEPVPGGLARSYQYGDFIFDVGPHRFHTYDEQVLRFINEVMDDVLLRLSRNTCIFYSGRYIKWPPVPAAVFQLSPLLLFRILMDLLDVDAGGKKANFREYILKSYGKTLYNIFFREYIEKFISLPADRIHADWAKVGMEKAVIDEKIDVYSLFKVVSSIILSIPVKTRFLYPRHGMGRFCVRLSEKIKQSGGRILLGSSVTGMEMDNGRIRRVFLEGEEIEPGLVIWTAPIDILASFLGLPDPGIEYLSLLLYNIEIKGDIKKKFQWCYYSDKEIVFNRVSVPSMFDPSLVPSGFSSLCAEVTCQKDSARWSDPMSLEKRIRENLVEVGLIEDPSSIKDMHVEKIREAYPVYGLDYMERLNGVRKGVSGTENLFLAGRTALFWYNNIDESIRSVLSLIDMLREQGIF